MNVVDKEDSNIKEFITYTAYIYTIMNIVDKEDYNIKEFI